MRGVKDDQDDERQKSRELDAKERESHRHECVGLCMRDVDRGLHDTGSEHRHAQPIDRRTCNTAGVQCQYDGSENRQILDAVGVCTH